jgi:hypothetical protein
MESRHPFDVVVPVFGRGKWNKFLAKPSSETLSAVRGKDAQDDGVSTGNQGEGLTDARWKGYI